METQCEISGQSDEREAETGDGQWEGLKAVGGTWLGACGSSRWDIRVAGSYSPLALLEHLAGVHRPLRDERSRLLLEKRR